MTAGCGIETHTLIFIVECFRYGTPFVALEKAAETAGPGVTCLWDFHHSMAVVNMIESDMEPIVILVLPDDAETVDPTTAPQEVQYALTMRSMYPDLISGTVYSSTVDGLVEQVCYPLYPLHSRPRRLFSSRLCILIFLGHFLYHRGVLVLS
jgi:hypothetical protein